MSEHTRQPWIIDAINHINACVNACAGMADPAAEIEKLKGQRDRAMEALRLMYKLHMKACDDAGGCPYDCLPGESCDSCTPSKAEKAARAAIAEIEGGE